MVEDENYRRKFWKCIIISVKNARMEMDIRTRPRIPVPDEDPYSIAGK